VIIIGAVAVFTTDGTMRGILNVIVFILMTPLADCGGFVFYRILFPFGLVRFAMPAIHITALMSAEVVRH
jgi:hypothetical protein